MHDSYLVIFRVLEILGETLICRGSTNISLKSVLGQSWMVTPRPFLLWANIISPFYFMLMENAVVYM